MSAFDQLVADGYQYVVADVQTATLKRLSVIAKANNVSLFNVSSTDGELRSESCSINTFHSILFISDEIKADALDQLMLKKRWTKWFLIKGRIRKNFVLQKRLSVR